jgi:phenylacetate-CoA ligase
VLDESVISVNSVVPGIAWPAIPSSAASAMLAMQFQLSQSQWLTPDELRRNQFQQLHALLSHAQSTVPFYRDRLEAAGFDVKRPVTQELFESLPLLSRREVQDHGPDLYSRAVPPTHGRTTEGTTSGSVGNPLRFKSTDLAYFFWHAFNLRDHLWHDNDFSRNMVAIRIGESMVLPNWFHGLDPVPFFTGPLVVVSSSAGMEEHIGKILEHEPTYLLGHATQVTLIAAECLRRSIRFSWLREARVFAEMLTPDARALIKKAWGCKVVDTYSTRECGYLALQCPKHEHFHVQEGVILEVLDAGGAPCKPGEVGRVIVTPLHNFAMPLIRYDLGDFAEVGAPCDCGRGLSVLKSIAGRVRNMLVLPSGRKIWPFLGFYRDTLPVRQRQVIQHSVEHIELKLVVDRKLTSAEEDEARAHFCDTVGHPFRVTVSYLDEIPRSAGGKFEEFISLVSA